MLSWLSEIKKSVVAAVGVALSVLSFAGEFDAVLPSGWGHIVGVLVAVLTPIATWKVENKPAA